MAIILDKDNEVVTYENQPEQARALFPNLCDCQDLAAQIEILKNDIDNKPDYIYDTAQGAVASFSDGADDAPVKRLLANIDPVQNLHGYDAPYPADGGKNKAKFWRYGYFDNNGNITGAATRINGLTMPLFLASGNSIVMSVKTRGVGRGIGVFSDSDMTPSNLLARFTELTGDFYISYTATQDCYVSFWYNFNGETIMNDVGFEEAELQIEVGTTTPSSYTPYSNICPITGWSGVEVARTSVNVWNEEWEVGSINDNTGADVAGNSVRSIGYIPILPKTAYYFYVGSGAAVRLFFYGKDKTYLSRIDTGSTTFTSPEGAYYCRFRTFSAYGTTYNNNISINYPATDTAYHSGIDNTVYSVTFPSEAGTVYGGSLDVTSGKLIVDRELFIITNNVVKTAQAAIGNYTRCIYAYNNIAIPTPQKGAGLFSHGVWKENYTSDDAHYYNTATQFIVFIKGSTSAECNAYIDAQEQAGTPLQITYTLAEAQVYNLTPREVRTLLGQNNIYADTGNVTVTFPCDLKLYIDKKLAEAE